MKKLLTICLIMATALTINAQDGKPTKEETIDYILMMMNEVTEIKIDSERYVPGDYVLMKYENTYFENCTLYYKISQKRGPNRVEEGVYSKQIDFSKVVEVYQNQKNGLNGDIITGGEIIGCKSIEKINGKSNIEYLSLYTWDAEKVLKALNHLRKLCGAPDPISFD